MAIPNTVPNQRILSVNKEPTDKNNLYTVNNLEAISEAARYLQTKAGFKLYIYIAKNQNNYIFALSSKDFCEWSGVGIAAYNSAFSELVDNGYLIPKENNKQAYMFYEKSRIDLKEKYKEKVLIEFDKGTNSDGKSFEF